MVFQNGAVFPAGHTTSKEVLIVEDEQSSRRALTLLLCSCGFRPQTFRTAEEALVWLQGGAHPQAALVDLDLPGMDGIELIGKLAQLSPATRSILVTATDQDTLTRRTRGRPICYIRKPVDFDSLLSLLERQ
jgi:DNA-binding NtrC family response regulator